MARLTDFDDIGRDYYVAMEMPRFSTTPWVPAKPVHQSRIAMISTAGLQRRGDRPFAVDRLVHHATIFEMNVESYRARKALERKRAEKKALAASDNQDGS